MTSESASQASASQAIAADRTDDVPSAWDERSTLLTMLDYTRDTVHAKCAGLSDADARRAPLPGSPLMTVSGLVSHLRWVESGWIEEHMLEPDALELPNPFKSCTHPLRWLLRINDHRHRQRS